jgi:hypothetical protein
MTPRPHILVATLVACTACSRGNAAAPEVVHELPDAVAGAVHTAAPFTAGNGREAGALPTLRTATVEGRPGPDGRPFEVALRTPGNVHARSFGRLSLTITMRDAATLGDYPCTSCHMARRIELGDARIADAHVNIGASHPRETGGCGTCHAADDVELLALGSGERASLDHAYRVCAGCHFPQLDAWAAGVHGKRLDAWQGQRVVMGCTDCHDPHAPALQRRLPFRPPSLHRPGGTRP